MIELFNEMLWQEIFVVALVAIIVIIYFNNK